MTKQIYRLCTLFLFITSSVNLWAAADANDEEAKLYVIYLGKNVHNSTEATHAHHHQLLSNVFDSKESVLKCLVYQYKHSFSGFSAMLTPSQADSLSKLPDVVSVFRSGMSKLHTTRSWTYLGLDQATGVWPDAKFGEDVIIGVFDTGIWPESASFDGTGLTSVPSRWKGECVGDPDFDSSLCNNKLIGAKFFFAGYESNHNDTAGITQSVRDEDGHGTHTASTIAGARVSNASFAGLAPGTAVGGAPSAKIAVYKVCWTEGCSDSDILAAYDAAISDGVDIISASLGNSAPVSLYLDGFAIGGFHATSMGILVSNSAGNDGPAPGTVTSCAPWLLTVAASTLDREFQSNVVLGDDTVVEGVTINLETSFPEEVIDIVDAADIPAAGATSEQAKFCVPNSLDSLAAFGKVVVCHQADGLIVDGEVVRYSVDTAVALTQGYGIIVVDNKFTSIVSPFNERYGLYQQPFPGAGVDDVGASTISTYTSSASSAATAIIKQPVTVIKKTHSPALAEFSSRGPNLASPYILKPDVTAPGVSILAAYSEALRLGDPVYKYKIISGTSMSCPHVSGASALIKSLHPTWTPAAIKSALMTTATPLTTGNILGYGAGEISIQKAIDPGLIYDLSETDYIEFLCASGFTAEQYRAITGGLDSESCPKPAASPSNLNYPTITVDTDIIVNRTVTNVGDAVSTYTVSVVAPPGSTVIVDPTELAFTTVNEKLTYTVSIQITDSTLIPNQGSLTWTDGTHNVMSAIFISTVFTS